VSANQAEATPAPTEVAASSPLVAVKPILRGWLHAGMTPVAAVAGLILILLAPSQYKLSAAIYTITAVMLFGTSALYHRGNWGPRTHTFLKRLDHANIFLIIAGTYTPLAIALLSPDQARTLLLVVWGGALAGVVFQVFWVTAPRWLSTLAYIALGWVAVFYLPAFWRTAGPGVVMLLLLGGIAYSIGGVVYARKHFDRWSKWFGFHEFFHALTIAGFTAHYIAVSIVLYRTA
jgi:hemolysin III